jgi:predicted permease
VRASLKLVAAHSGASTALRTLIRLLYLPATIALIYGEWTALTGLSQRQPLGGAAPAAILIVLGAALVLVGGPLVARQQTNPLR